MSDNIVTLAHGSGARESWEIVERLFRRRTPPKLMKTEGGYGLDVLDDGAVIRVGDSYVVISVDSFTVNPIFFPGGDIGHLAASGTINDLVVMGATPTAFMDSIVVEEGFPMDDLEKIVGSMTQVLFSEGVALVGGDFKVMPRGAIDKIVVTATGVGISEGPPIVDTELRPGDKIVVTGPIAQHGAAILAAQLGVDVKIVSDSRPLTRTVLPVIKEFRSVIDAARDPTRGGLAAVLNEWARACGCTIVIDRARVPIEEPTMEFLDAMGVDPLTMACEGVAVLAVRSGHEEQVAEMLREKGEKRASVVGEVVKPPTQFLRGRVVARTEVGGRVLVEPKPVNLPRIC